MRNLLFIFIMFSLIILNVFTLDALGTTFYGENANGILEIDTSILEADPNGIDGSGIITLLSFYAVSSGNSNISLDKDNCLMLNSKNGVINIDESVNAIVEIQLNEGLC